MESATSWVERVFDEYGHFKNDFIASQQWVVVPVESGLHFDEGDAKRLAEAACQTNHPMLTAVLLEELLHVDDEVPVEATKQSLLAFSKKYGHFNCLLAPRDLSFAIVCTTNDYYLVAGSPNFVRLALGSEIGEARAKFAEFAGNEMWDLEDRTRLLDIKGRYE